MQTNTSSRSLYFLSLAAVFFATCLSSVTAQPVVFEDTFEDDTSTEQVLDRYQIGQWAKAGRPKGSAELDPDSHTLTLSASTIDKDGELGRELMVVSLYRKTDIVTLGNKPLIEIEGVFNRIDALPVGKGTVCRAAVGLQAVTPGKSALRGYVGLAGPRGEKRTLVAVIELQDDTGRRVVVERSTPKFGDIAGKPVTLRIEGGSVDLLVGGESVVGGPKKHSIDLVKDSMSQAKMRAAVHVQKVFGTEPRSAKLTRLTLRQQPSEAAAKPPIPNG